MPVPPVAASSTAVYVPRREPRYSVVDGREGRIALTHWGPPDPAPIVLLHGWMDCGAAWQLLVDCLPDDWPLVALDWPGYGRSDWHPRHYWYPEHLAELESVLEAIAPQQPVRLIAHSMGGTVASMYSGIRAASIGWTVSMEGYGMPPLLPAQLPAHLASWLDEIRQATVPRRYSDLEELAVAVRRANPRLPPAHARYLAEVWTRSVDQGFEMRADPRQQWRSPLRFGRAELEACWAGITAPFLLLHGAESNYLARAAGSDALARWGQLIPRFASETIAEAGHLLPYEQPQRVAQAIMRFVAAQS